MRVGSVGVLIYDAHNFGCGAGPVMVVVVAGGELGGDGVGGVVVAGGGADSVVVAVKFHPLAPGLYIVRKSPFPLSSI